MRQSSLSCRTGSSERMRISKRGIALLLAAILTAAALYYGHRRSNAAQGVVLPELISLAPADASYLFYADLAALRSSPFLTHLLAPGPAAAQDREYAEFVRATGFDYARDLDRVVLALRPGLPGLGTVALAEGRFDREKISGYALRSGKLERQSGVKVYVVPADVPAATRAQSPVRQAPGAGLNSGRVIAFAFLDPPSSSSGQAHRIVLADGPSLGCLLAPPKRGNALAPAMRERVSRVAGSALFGVGQVGPVPEHFSFGGIRSDQLANLVRSLRWFTLAAHPEGEHLRVTVEGECDTAESARQLAGTLDGLRLLGEAALADPGTRQRLEPQTAALLATLVRMLRVSRDDQGERHSVRLTLDLTPEMLGSLAGAALPKNPAARPSAR